jgi:hypothetical protein
MPFSLLGRVSLVLPRCSEWTLARLRLVIDAHATHIRIRDGLAGRPLAYEEKGFGNKPGFPDRSP